MSKIFSQSHFCLAICTFKVSDTPDVLMHSLFPSSGLLSIFPCTGWWPWLSVSSSVYHLPLIGSTFLFNKHSVVEAIFFAMLYLPPEFRCCPGFVYKFLSPTTSEHFKIVILQMFYFSSTSSGVTIPQGNNFMLFLFQYSLFVIHLMLPYVFGIHHPWFFCTYWVSSPSESLHKELWFDDSGNVSVTLCSVWLYLLCFIAIALVRRISVHALFFSLEAWNSSWDLYWTQFVRLSWFLGPIEVNLIYSYSCRINCVDFSSLMSIYNWSFILKHFPHIFPLKKWLIYSIHLYLN